MMHPPHSTTEDGHHPASSFRLFWLSLILAMPAVIFGLNVYLSTVALPLLDLSIDTASWMGSIGIYAGLIGSLLSGIVIDKFGRKAALIFGIAPSLVGWSLLYWNYSDAILLLGQTLNGLCIGSLMYSIHVYAGECILKQNVRLRNDFMILVGLLCSLGTIEVIFLSTFLDYSHICATGLVTVIVIMITFSTVIPESPTWLRFQGRHGEADKCEKKLGLGKLIDHNAAPHNDVKLQLAASGWNWNSMSQSMKKLKRPDVYKPFYICCIGEVLRANGGIPTVMIYIINIIDDTIPGQVRETARNATTVKISQSISGQQLSLFCALFAIAGCLLSACILSKVGMRKFFITMHIFVAISLGILTYCSFDGAVGVLQLRVTSLAVITFSSGCSLGPFSTSSADMFPVDCKGFYSIPKIIGSLVLATANKTFPYLYLSVGGYAYCVYVFMNLLNIIYLYALFPEVVGKTLEQINDDFLGKKQDEQKSESVTKSDLVAESLVSTESEGGNQQVMLIQQR